MITIRDLKWNGQIAIKDMTDEHLKNAKQRLTEEIAETEQHKAADKQLNLNASDLTDFDVRIAERKNWLERIEEEIDYREDEIDNLENV